MSSIDSGYEVSEIRSLGNDIFKIVLRNDITNDGFAVDIPDYSTIEDEDFNEMLKDAVDLRLDELETVLVDQAERAFEEAPMQTRKGWKIKKTDSS